MFHPYWKKVIDSSSNLVSSLISLMVDFTLYRFQVGPSAHLDSAVSGSQGARPRRGPSDPAARQGDILPEGAGRGKRGPVAPHILHNPATGTQHMVPLVPPAGDILPPAGEGFMISNLYIARDFSKSLRELCPLPSLSSR